MTNQSETEGKAKCPKCGKPRAQASASITQWLFRQDNCDCDILDYSSKDIEEEISQLCQTCGKPLPIGRTGSMTQWVFRAQSCACDSPVIITPTTAARAAATAAAENALFETQRTVDEELKNPLDVDPGKFPTDRYIPIAVLGDGQHGIVYKAHDRLLKRKVAIKTVRTTRLSSEQLVQFQAEAKATSQLNHPNVIGLFDFGVTADSVPFLVMEYFEGETLKDLINENGPLPLSSGIFVLVQACAGLQHAHEKRILHRDLKSSNIMVGSKDGRTFLKILDFGLSSLISQTPDDGNTTSLRGTPTHMSPEQVREQAVDERSDLYSLGCVAYEVFTGRVPFREENTLATMMKHVEAIPEALSVANPEMECNEDLELIVAKALEKNPDDRYESMNELKHELQSVRFPERDSSAVETTHSAISIPTRSTLGSEAESKAASRKSLVFISILIVSFAIGGLIVVNSIKPAAPDVSLSDGMMKREHVFVDPKSRKSNSSSPEVQSELHKSDMVREGTLIDDPGFWVSRKGPGTYENPDATDDTLTQLQDLSKYPDMKVLSLRGTGVIGPGLKHLIKRPLYGIVLSETGITDEALKWLGQTKSLRTLTLNHTHIPVDAWDQITSLKLESLEICDADVNDEVIQSISKIKTLKELRIGDNHDLSNKSFTYLNKLKNLESLDIGNSSLTCDGFKELTSLKKLRVLWAPRCPILDNDVDALQKFPLENLILSARYLTDKGLLKLASTNARLMSVEDSGHLSRKAKVELARKVSPRQLVYR